MSVTTTHLDFRGKARAALDFYQSIYGGDLTVVTYKVCVVDVVVDGDYDG